METASQTTDDPTASLCRFQRSDTPNDGENDFFSVEFRGRNLRIFRPVKHGKRLAAYYVKCEVHGRQIFRGTGEERKTKAIEVAKLIVGAALDEKWDALRETKLRKEKQVATIGEVLGAFRKRVADFNLTIKEKTVEGYVGALKSVLRRVHEGELERLSSSVLTEDLVEKFFASYVREAGEDFLERDRRIRGANSLLRNARSLFGQDAMKCYRGLQLPDLSGFLKATTAESPDVQHKEIAPETMKEIATAAKGLREERPALYLVHLLYRHLGMRNDEIENARLEWIERRKQVVFLPNGEKREIAAVMVIKRRSYWVPKRSVGEVPISPDVLAEIDAMVEKLRPDGTELQPTDHLVRTRTLTERADLVDRDHADFLRPWTSGHAKVSYELRRWAATVVAQRQGEEFAERFLRHKSKTVAGRHYITQQAPPAPVTLGDCGLEGRSE